MITIENILFDKGHPRSISTTGGEIILKDRCVMSISIQALDRQKDNADYEVLCREELECNPGDDEQKILVKLLRALIDRLKEKPTPIQKESK